MQYKYNLGDRVSGNKTGYMIPSNVVGVISSYFYLEKMNDNQHMVLWEELYPDYKDKPVYICKFDSPSKTFTFEEMVKQIKEPLEERVNPPSTIDVFLYQLQNLEEVLRLHYKLFTPEFSFVAYPEDDLVKLDDIC